MERLCGDASIKYEDLAAAAVKIDILKEEHARDLEQGKYALNLVETDLRKVKRDNEELLVDVKSVMFPYHETQWFLGKGTKGSNVWIDPFCGNNWELGALHAIFHSIVRHVMALRATAEIV